MYANLSDDDEGIASNDEDFNLYIDDVSKDLQDHLAQAPFLTDEATDKKPSPK